MVNVGLKEKEGVGEFKYPSASEEDLLWLSMPGRGRYRVNSYSHSNGERTERSDKDIFPRCKGRREEETKS